jgi:hypothetical protein
MTPINCPECECDRASCLRHADASTTSPSEEARDAELRTMNSRESMQG